jgi:ribonucleotide monophosphatase NagD (HAD superfamily)
MQTLTQRLGVLPEQVLVIGDDLILECSMARASGALSFLVTTGTNSAADADAAPAEQKPDVVVESMTAFVELLSRVFEASPHGV